MGQIISPMKSTSCKGGSRRLNVSRETFWRSFQEIICLIRPIRLTRFGTEEETSDAAGNLSGNSNGYAYSWDEEERLLTVTINGSYDLRFFHLFDAHDRIVVRLPRGNVELFTRKEAVAFGPVDLKIATLDLIDLGAARVASGARSEADWIALPDAKALGVLP